MKSRSRLKINSTLMLMLLSCSVFAGPGYKTIDPPVNTTVEAGQVEVLEYFWFGCPHCFAFEPVINDWAAKKPEHVTFIREAPPLNPGWMPHSQAFYAAEVMGVTERMFEPFFNAIHKDKRRLRKPSEIADFMGELGIDSKKFLATMESFAVQARIKQSMLRAQASGITGVPSMVVNGKYLTGNSIAGGHEGIVRVLDELVESEKASGS